MNLPFETEAGVVVELTLNETYVLKLATLNDEAAYTPAVKTTTLRSQRLPFHLSEMTLLVSLEST